MAMYGGYFYIAWLERLLLLVFRRSAGVILLGSHMQNMCPSPLSYVPGPRFMSLQLDVETMKVDVSIQDKSLVF